MGSDDRQAAAGESSIQELMGRIDAFREAKSAATGAESFRWETDPGGLVRWVEGVPRASLIGQSILPGEFKRRAPFRDARFSIRGPASESGEWRVSGVPFYDPGQGHFLGYRGSARRDQEEAAPVSEPERLGGLFGTDLPSDALRQLIHELRTPLNAISGFAEMIEGQYLGPAEDAYRTRASRIRAHAGSLLSAVDDLDTAARAESSRPPEPGQGGVDLVALLYRLHEEYGRGGPDRAMLRMQFARDLPLARVDAEAAERMLSRLLGAALGLSREGETLVASVSLSGTAGGDMICLAVDRPSSLLGVEEPLLFDPAYAPEGNWPAAPALGPGFALRLVRNLAEAAGGGLSVNPDRFLLALPPLDPTSNA